jgi:hypothetical protein
MRRRSIVLVLAGTCAAIALAGCQRQAKEPTQNDASTVQAMLSSGAAVQRAVQPLYMCLPEDKRCYRDAGQTVVQVVEAERGRIAPIIAATDDGCLKDVGRSYDESLAAYLAAGRAALAGDSAAVDKAISRSSKAEISYSERLGECGFAQGQFARITTSLRKVNVDIIELDEQMYACADFACVMPLARRLEHKASEATALISEFHASLGEAPACLDHALIEFRSAFVAIGRSAVATQKGDFLKATTEAMEAGRLQAQAQEDMAACLGSISA